MTVAPSSFTASAAIVKLMKKVLWRTSSTTLWSVQMQTPGKLLKLLRQGIPIEVNNQPVPEITVHDPNDPKRLFISWGLNGICEQLKEQLGKFDAKFENYSGCYDPQALFEHLFQLNGSTMHY
jgi:hypothetical protein